MIGLIKKDLYLIVRSFNLAYLLAFLMFIIPTALNAKMFFPMLALWLAIICATQISSAMTLDEEIDWRRLVSYMPVSVHAEVGAKYLLSYFLTAISGILMLVIGYTFSLVIPSLEERRHEILLYTIVCLCLCLLYNAVMIPATYKFGSVKGKVILLLFIALLPLLGILLMKGFHNISNSVIAGRSVVRFLVIIDLILVELASYVLALRFRDDS